MKRLTAIILAATLIITGMAAAFAEGNRIWQTGDTGETVTRIQKKLIELEYLKGEADGIFDEATENALRRFQRDQRLLETGKADSVTPSNANRQPTRTMAAGAYPISAAVRSFFRVAGSSS